MPILHAIVLGVVQGLTEFLPISSSGHLIVVPWLFGWNDLKEAGVEKAFDVALHLGTLVAVVAYFRRDLVRLVGDGVRAVVRRDSPATFEGRLAWLLVLSAVPAAAVGALFENWIDDELGTPTIIAVSLVVFGLLLWWADRRSGSRDMTTLSTRDALVIGGAQVLALNPGTSRSGITMTAGRVLGFDRDTAARFSFLMSLPVTLGAVVVKVGGLVADGVPDDLVVPMVVGVLTAAVAGWFAVWGTLRLVRTKNFDLFVVYRVIAGVAILAVVSTSWR